MTPGAWLTCCLVCLLTAVVAGQANDAAQDRSVSASDAVLEAMLGRSGYPRKKVRGTSQRWNPFFRDFDASAAETDNEVGPPYVVNSVGQRSDSGTSSLTVVRRRSARISFGTTQTTSASRLFVRNNIEVKQFGVLVSGNETRRARKTEVAMHNAEKLFLDKMASDSSDDNMSTLSKNSSDQAFIAPPMSGPEMERQPASLLRKLIRRAVADLPDLRFYDKKFRRTCEYSLDSGTSDIEPGCVESTYEGEYVIPVSQIVRCIVLYFIIAAVVIKLLASACTSSSRQAGQAGAGTDKPCGRPKFSSKCTENISCHPEQIV